MIPHNEGIPSELLSLPAGVQRGFYALGTNTNPSFKKHYCFACLQAGCNLSRLLERAKAFVIPPLVCPVRLRSIVRGSEGVL